MGFPGSGPFFTDDGLDGSLRSPNVLLDFRAVEVCDVRGGAGCNGALSKGTDQLALLALVEVALGRGRADKVTVVEAELASWLRAILAPQLLTTTSKSCSRSKDGCKVIPARGKNIQPKFAGCGSMEFKMAANFMDKMILDLPRGNDGKLTNRAAEVTALTTKGWFDRRGCLHEVVLDEVLLTLLVTRHACEGLVRWTVASSWIATGCRATTSVIIPQQMVKRGTDTLALSALPLRRGLVLALGHELR